MSLLSLFDILFQKESAIGALQPVSNGSNVFSRTCATNSFNEAFNEAFKGTEGGFPKLPLDMLVWFNLKQ